METEEETGILGTSEAQEVTTSKAVDTESLEDQMTLEEFITAVKPHPGLVASFKVEAKDLGPRSHAAWERSFLAQSERVYK